MKLPSICARIVLLYAVLAAAAPGGTFTWDGSTDSNLAEASNWVGGVAPAPADDILVFPSGAPLALTQNFGSGTDFFGLSFQAPGYTLSGTSSFDLIPSVGDRAFIQLLSGVGNGTVTINTPFRIRSPGSTNFNIHVAGGSSILDINEIISNESSADDLEITGDGTVRFDADMAYTGLTTVGTTTDNSRLVLTGSVSGPVLINQAGTLHASGEIGSSSGPAIDLTVKGAFKPGDPTGSAIGSPFIHGDLTFEQGVASLCKVVFDINGVSQAAYDRILVSGAVVTGGANLEILPSTGFPLGEIFTLIDNGNSDPINHANPFKINSISVSEGSEFTIGMNRYRFSYQGGAGDNDFVATTVPSISLGNLEWDGGGTTRNFSEAANWVGDALPDAAHTLVFGSLAATPPLENRLPINDIGGNPYALSFTASGYELSGSPLTLTGGLTASHASGINDIGVDLTLAAPQTFALTNAGRLDLNGAINNDWHLLTCQNSGAGEIRLLGGISGTGGLTKTGTGLMTMVGSGTNSYDGLTTINEGAIHCSRTTGNHSIPGNLTIGDGVGPSGNASLTTTITEQIADDATVTVRSDAMFFPGAFETIGGLVLNGGLVDGGANILAVAGNITVNSGVMISSPLQINGAVRDWTVASGEILQLAGPLTISPANTGTTQRKLGAGTLLLSGNAPNTVMELAAGTLRLANAAATTTLGVALNGGTLDGSGKLLAISTLGGGGVVSPSTGTGSAIIQATQLALGSNASLVLDIADTTPGTGHDQLAVSGTVSLANTPLTLRNTISSLLPVGTGIVLIDNDAADAVTGTFAGLPEGSIIQTQFNQYVLSYVGGTGNDVTLTVVLPGPSGQTRTWTGNGGNSNWTTAANWDTGAPQPGDALVFPSNVHLMSTNDYPVGFTFSTISFTGTPSNTTARVISGNAIRSVGDLSSNVALGTGGGTQDVRVEIPITFAASSVLVTNAGPRRLVFTGPVTTPSTISFLGDDLPGTNRREIIFSGGTLSGPGEIRINDNVQLDLGAAAHSYAGTTEVIDGLLIGNLDQVLRNNFLLGGFGHVAVATLVGSPTAHPGAVEIYADATLNLTSGSLLCSSLTMGGGTLNATGRPVATTGNVTVSGGLGSIGALNAPNLLMSGGTFTTNGAVEVTTIQANGGDFSTSLPITSETITIAGGTLAGSTLITADSLVMTSGTFKQATQVNLDTLNLTGGTVAGTGIGGILGHYTVTNDATVQVVMPCASLAPGTLTVSGSVVATGAVNTTTTTTVAGSISSASFTCATLALQNGNVDVSGSATITNAVLIDGSDSFTAGSLNAVAGATVSGGTLSCGTFLASPGNGLVLNTGSLEITDSLSTSFLNFAGGTFTGPGPDLEVINLFQTTIPVQCASITAGTLQINAGAVSATDSVTADTLNLAGGSLACTGPVIATSASTLAGTLTCATFTTPAIALNNGKVTVGGLADIEGDLAIDGSDSFTCGSLQAANFSITSGSSPKFTVATHVTLSGNATVSKSLSIPGSLIFETTDSTVTVSGSTLTATNLGGLNPGSAVRVIKLGGGSLKVSSSLTHLTEVVVAAGTFRSDAPDGGDVGNILVEGGTLSGTGVFGPVTVKGVANSLLAPGSTSGPGILTLSDFEDTTPGSPPHLQMEIFGPAEPGVFHDQIRATGDVVFNPAVQTRLDLQLKGVFYSPTFAPLVGTTYVLIDKTSPGPISGNLYNGTDPLDPDDVVVFQLDPDDSEKDVHFAISYTGGDGNDLTATVTQSPAGEFRIWTGLGADNLWSTKENWLDDAIPKIGEGILFPAGSLQTTNHNNLSPDLPIGRMRVEAPYEISGNRLVLTRDLELEPDTGTAILKLPVFLKNGTAGSPQIHLTGAAGARLEEAITLDPSMILVLNRVQATGGPPSGPLEVSAIQGSGGNGVEIHGGGIVRFLSAQRAYGQPTRVLDGTLDTFSSPFGVIPGDLHIGGGPNPAAYVFTGLDGGIPNTAKVRLLPNGTARFPDRPGELFSGDIIGALSFEGGTLINEGVINVINEIRATTDTVVNAPLIYRSFSDPDDFDRLIVEDGATLTIGSGFQLFFAGGPDIPDIPGKLVKLGSGNLLVPGRVLRVQRLEVQEGFVGPAGTGELEIPEIVVTGGTFGGQGTVVGNLEFTQGEGGIFAPGGVEPSTKIGKLMQPGRHDFIPSAATEFLFQIGGTEAGTGYDQLDISPVFEDLNLGKVLSLNSAKLHLELVDGFVPTSGQKFRLIDKRTTADTDGVFRLASDPAFPDLPEGTVFSAAGVSWSISYSAGAHSNSVELTALGTDNTGIAVELPEGNPIPSGSIVPFGSKLFGTQNDMVFTIRSTGEEPLVLTGDPPVQLAASPDFTIVSPPATTITGQGQTTTFTVRYTPVAAGLNGANLTIRNNTIANSVYTLLITGRGLDPTTPPAVTLLGDNPLTFEAAPTYTDPGATATDNAEGELTPVITSNTVVPNALGTYQVTWSVTDAGGLVTSTTRTVNVVDTTPPSIQPPPGNFTPLLLEVGSTVPDYLAQATITDLFGVASTSQNPPAGTEVTLGLAGVILSATDNNGITGQRFVPAFPIVSPVEHDASEEFSITNGNPNGVWSYGTLPATPGTTFTAFTETATGALNIWRPTAGTTLVPSVARNETGAVFNGEVSNGTISGDTLGVVRLQPGEMMLNPGLSGIRVAVRFTAPQTAVYRFQGAFTNVAEENGAAVITRLHKGAVELYSRTWSQSGSGVRPTGEATAQPFDVSVAMTAGETVDVSVSQGSSVGRDSVGLTLTATQLAPGSAADQRWTGGTGNWSTDAKWNFLKAPVNGLPLGSLYNAIVDIHASVVTLDEPLGPGVPLELQKLTLGVARENSVNVTVSGAAPLTIHDTLNWHRGTLSSSGGITFGPSSTVNVAGTNGGTDSLSTNILNQGSMTVSPAIINGVPLGEGSARLIIAKKTSVAATPQFTNDGTFTLHGVADLHATGNGGGSIINNGTLIKTGATGEDSQIENRHTFTNNGLIQVDGGILTLNNGTHQGSYQLAADSELRLTGAQNFAVASTVNGAGTLAVTGGTTTANAPLAFNSGARISSQFVANDEVDFNGPLTLDAPGNFVGISGPADVRIHGVTDWTQGWLFGAGKTIFPEDATTNVTGNSVKLIYTRHVINRGTMNVTGIKTVPSGSLLDLRDNAILDNEGEIHFVDQIRMWTNGTGTNNQLNNSGLVTKSGEGTTNIWSIKFNNTGRVEVQSGILQLDNDGTHTAGEFAIAAGGVLRLMSAHVADADTTFTGDGELQLNGSITLNGNTIEVPTSINAGFIAGNGVAFDRNVTWTDGYMTGNATTTILAGRTLHVTGAGVRYLTSSRKLLNQGTVTMNGSFGLAGASRLENEGLFTANGESDFGNGSGTIVNQSTGTFIKDGTVGQTTSMSGIPFVNSGLVEARGGTLSFDSTYTQTAGSLVLKGGSISKPGSAMAINGGKLEGSGTVTGAVAVNGGTVDPGTFDPELGAIPGILVTTSLSLTGATSTTLAFDVVGAGPGELAQPGVDHDQLQVTGTLALGTGILTRNLAISFPDDIAPLFGKKFVLATANSITGSFTNAPSGAVATTLDGRYSFRVFYGAGSPEGANQIVIKEISELIPPVLTLPANITMEATALETPVPFAVSALDNIDGPVTAIASLTVDGPAIASPHPFPIGTTTVFVRALDSRNNRADGQFTATVQDTTHPTLTVPAGPVTASTTNINGIAVEFATSATDLPGAPAPVVLAVPASGSLFPLGETTVTVTATDGINPATVKTFKVIVTGLPDIGVQFTGGAEIPEGSGKITFDPTPVLTPASPKSITIRNDGAAPLNLGSATFGDPHAGDFGATGLVGSPILAPGQSIVLQIAFTPAEKGLRSSTLHLASNDPDPAELVYDIAVTGTGITGPDAITSAATAATYHGATLNGSVNANAAVTEVTFEYGTTTAYGKTVDATLATLESEDLQPVSANLAGLLDPETTYHFRVKAVNANGTAVGDDFTFTTTTALPGSLDPSFLADVNGTIETMAVQPDGKILIGGAFTQVDGVSRNRIARLNPDGSLDPSFDPGSVIPVLDGSTRVFAIAIQRDGKILVGGRFGVGGFSPNLLLRLDPDGSVDNTWTTQISGTSVNSIVIDDLGRVHIGGQFSAVSSIPTTPGLVTLDANGVFLVNYPSVPGTIHGMALAQDRSVFVTGQVAFGAGLGKIPGLGGLIPLAPATGQQQAILQPDDKIVIVQKGTSTDSMSRINPNLSADSGFIPSLPFARFSSLGMQADSRMLIAANGGPGYTPGVTRLLVATGTTDPAFTTVPLSPFTEVTSVAQQADGRILIAGSFTSVDGVSRQRIARLTNEPATESLTVPLPNRIEWLRGGTSPSTQMVTFDYSPNGGPPWQFLGQGTRIAGGWELIGTLPVGGTIRATARTAGGRLSSSSGLVQSQVAYNSPTITEIADQTTDEDTPLGPIAVTIGDPVNPASSLTLSATSSNTALVPVANIAFGGSNEDRNVTITPLANQSGTTTITLTVGNGTLSTFTSFTVTVLPVNDAPTLATISNPASINEDAGLQTVNLSVIGSGAANETQTLVITATSDDPSLIPHPTVSYTSPNATGSLSYTPVANANGSALITVTVDDGGSSNKTVERSFTVTVNAVNDAPVLDPSRTPTMATVPEDPGAPVGAVGTLVSALVDFTTPSGQVDNVTDVDAGDQPGIAVTAVDANFAAFFSTDGGLTWLFMGTPSVSTARLLAADADNRIYLRPTTNVSGTFSSALVFRAWDRTNLLPDGNTANTTINGGTTAFSTATDAIVQTVIAVNDTPTLAAIADPAEIDEDAGLQTVNLSGIGTGAANETQPLVITATSDDPSLIPHPTVSYTSPNATGSLSYTPVANTNGSALITVTVNDGGPSNNTVERSFTVTVNAVNDAPVLDPSRTPTMATVLEDPGAPVGAVGTLVSALVDFATPSGQVDNVTDVDAGDSAGIAVTAVDANFTAFYSTDGGLTWLSMGTPSVSAARLLLADVNNRVYLRPNTDVSGTFSSALVFRAWDRSNLLPDGSAADTTINGGATAFSIEADAIVQTVTAVYDEPTVTNLSLQQHYLKDVPVYLTNSFVTAPDSPIITATLTLSNPSAGSLDTSTSGSVTSTYNPSTGLWSAEGPVASVNSLLARTRFIPASGFEQSFTIATSFSDGIAPPIVGMRSMMPINANLLYQQDFNSDDTANWTVNNSGLSDISVDFFHDYSAIGVPPAPNGSGTRGLKMTANNTGGVFSGFSVSPTGRNFAGEYLLTFDLWSNYAGPLGPGGSGTTQLSTYGIGTAGNVAIWSASTPKECVMFANTLDGGSAADYRVGSSVAPTFYASGNAVYQAPGGLINNSDAYYSVFESLSAPAAQITLFSGQTGTTDVGECSFRWVRASILVKDGFATWSLNGVPIAKINLSTVTLGGGNIFFGHSDTNATSSSDLNDELLNATLIDNINVYQLSPLLSPLELWRQTHFGTTANSGNAADLFDFDKDGIVNLIEFAFGLTPTVPDAHLMPQAQKIGNELVLSFTPPPGVSGITYGAETSETLAPGDWAPVPNTGTVPVHEFKIPLGTKPKDFIRLTVTGQAEE